MNMAMDYYKTCNSLKEEALNKGVELEEELCEFVLAAGEMIEEELNNVEFTVTEGYIRLSTKVNESVDLLITVNNEDPDEIRFTAVLPHFTNKLADIIAKKIVEGTLINNYLGLEITMTDDKVVKRHRHLVMNYTAYICTGQVDQALGEFGFIALMFKEEINQAFRAVENILTGGRYKVVLQDVDDNRPILLIKAVKDSAGMTLRQAKETVRTRRVIGVESYEEAVKIRDDVITAGAVAEIVDTEDT